MRTLPPPTNKVLIPTVVAHIAPANKVFTGIDPKKTYVPTTVANNILEVGEAPGPSGKVVMVRVTIGNTLILCAPIRIAPDVVPSGPLDPNRVLSIPTAISLMPKQDMLVTKPPPLIPAVSSLVPIASLVPLHLWFMLWVLHPQMKVPMISIGKNGSYQILISRSSWGKELKVQYFKQWRSQPRRCLQ